MRRQICNYSGASGSRRAAAILRRLGDRRRLAEVSALLAWVAHFQGRFTTAATMLAELERFGRHSGDAQVQS
jgi:hypothetical protein